MAKDKNKAPKGAHNKHLSARVAFLFRASTHLASQQAMQQSPEALKSNAIADPFDESTTADTRTSPPPQAHIGGLPFLLTAQLKQVALRSQTRLDVESKRAICKVCGAVLIEGQTCRIFVENASRGARKQHADVTIIACGTCGNKKRIPTGAKRQQRKSQRSAAQQQSRVEAIPSPQQHLVGVVYPNSQKGINAATTLPGLS
ncbi:hypothetical protein BST61_g9526 [Cercospora zeina]